MNDLTAIPIETVNARRWNARANRLDPRLDRIGAQQGETLELVKWENFPHGENCFVCRNSMSEAETAELARLLYPRGIETAQRQTLERDRWPRYGLGMDSHKRTSRAPNNISVGQASGGVGVPASYDYRREYIDRAAGREPSVIGEPYWD